jgi:hypothetical protein
MTRHHLTLVHYNQELLDPTWYFASHMQRIRYVSEAVSFGLCINYLLGSSTIYCTLPTTHDSYIRLSSPCSIYFYNLVDIL